MEARVECIDSRTVRAPLTLRELTEKKLNDKSPHDQEADPCRRATAKKYSTR
jgi:hypothetical protein